jgi:hypothetical protein
LKILERHGVDEASSVVITLEFERAYLSMATIDLVGELVIDVSEWLWV